MNFLEGRIDISERTFACGDVRLPLLAGQCERLGNRGRVTLGIRPEYVHVSLNEQAGSLRATVYVTELMGNETFVFLQMGGEKIIARAPSEFRAEPNAPAFVKIEMDRAAFFDAESGVAI